MCCLTTKPIIISTQARWRRRRTSLCQRCASTNPNLKQLGVRIVAARGDNGKENAPDEKAVAREIGDIFKAYQRSHRSYPVDYEALNQLLPPEKGLLRWYEVIAYKGGRQFYSIKLRNRNEHKQVLELAGSSLLR